MYNWPLQKFLKNNKWGQEGQFQDKNWSMFLLNIHVIGDGQ